MTSASREPFEIFFSYSQRDQRLRNQLETQLSFLRREGLITTWYNHKIMAGDEWAGKIDEHLNKAQIILLLVSADFIASDYCYGIEMRRALERHEAGKARVIPVILRPIEWKQTPFGKLKPLPTGGKPVIKWTDRDSAFHDIAQGIRKVIEELTKNSHK